MPLKISEIIKLIEHEDIADLFSGPDDPQWEHDRILLDDSPVNPWSR